MPVQPKKTRNRVARPSWSWSGLTSQVWRSDTTLVQWAQQAPQFRDLYTVLLNERETASQPFSSDAGVTENRQLGRVEGYNLALQVLASLATGATPAAKAADEPTYEPSTEAILAASEEAYD